MKQAIQKHLRAIATRKNLEKVFMVAAVATLAVAAVEPAMAGTGGTDFTDIYTTLTDWSKGTLGKTLAMAMFLVGIGAGVVKQSVVAAVTGIGGALVLNYGPAVIDGVFTALV